MSSSPLRVIPLGGMGTVTQNMFVYEYEDELLIVDCGIGFPDVAMPGVDVLIPDTAYVLQQLENGKKIVGMILTHGHDDHIGALPYILPELPQFPIFGSPLTAGFATKRMGDIGLERPVTVVQAKHSFKIGTHFEAMGIVVTHSVPDTRHYVITTPVGKMYHGSDFKLDQAPVGGELTDMATIEAVGNEGILCQLIDCLRVERPNWTKSETMVGPVLDEQMAATKGTFIVTLMSSHIHRIQQVISAAAKHGRKVAFVGRSVEQNVEVALQLEKMSIPPELYIDKRDIQDTPAHQLCIVIAGSQGQEGSSLMRAISGDHPVLRIKPEDRVVFSADVIPGNELNFYGAIDELCRNGIEVEYPDVVPDIHQSGHASAPEQQTLLKAVHPKFVLPVGGADRHRVKFVELVAKEVGMTAKQVLIPGAGDVLEFTAESVRVAERVNLRPRAVDGLGIGDVGPVVLSDRRILGQAGIIVVVLPRRNGAIDVKNISLVSRGFVFMKEADEVMEFIKTTAGEVVSELGKKAKDEELKRQIERRLARKLYRIIQREPMIVPVIIEM
jgi:ribonuclease J